MFTKLFIKTFDNKPDAALRIFDNDQVIYYTSTRLGALERIPGGYNLLLSGNEFKHFNGSKYELKVLGKKRLTYAGTIELEAKSETKTKKTEGEKA